MTESIQKAIRFIDEVEKYRESDSHEFFLLLRENRTLYSILLMNHRELNKILKYHNDEQIVKRFWDSDNSFRFKLQKNIIRHLSNYLFSLFSVVEYSRSTLEKYLKANPDIYSKFENEKKAFLLNSKHKFIQDLRNYTSHNTYIKIGSQFSYNIEWSEPRKTIYIFKKELLLWDGWTSASKRFIAQSEDKIHLNEIINSHFEEFLKFQNWVFLQLLLVDDSKTIQFILDVKDIYARAKENNQVHLLLFKDSYLRYIDYILVKARLSR
jgi:uncharacterized protein YjgD (DUF1641 family)